MDIEFKENVEKASQLEMIDAIAGYFTQVPMEVLKLRVSKYPGTISMHPPLHDVHTVRLIGDKGTEVISEGHFVLHAVQRKYEILKLSTPKTRTDIADARV